MATTHNSYEAQWKNVGFTWAENVRAWKQCQTIDQYDVVTAEQIQADDGKRIAIHKHSHEDMSVSSEFEKKTLFTRNPAEKIGFYDKPSYSWLNSPFKWGDDTWSEAVMYHDRDVVFDVSKSQSTDISVDVVNSNVPSLLKKEAVVVQEDARGTVTFARNFSESISIADEASKDIAVNNHEPIVLQEDMLNNSGAVVSDIIVSATEIPTMLPAGYGDWQPFVSGDYKYREALLKCVMKIEGNTNTIVLPKYTVFVDLPDIQDHAVTRIESAENTYIPFNLDFYRVPEVTITTVGGMEVVIPIITKVTEDGFWVELRNLDKELSTGTISWSALGC